MRMDKITLITGANRGLGFEFVKQLFSKGHRIVATARSTQDSHELIDFVKKNPNQIEFHELDVSLPESIANLTNLLKTLPHFDWLINNAGTFGERHSTSLDAPVSEYENVMRVNVWGPLQMAKICFPYLKKSATPLMASVTSRMGSIADNDSGGYGPYRLSKAALNMLNKNLSIEFPDITCLVLHPGWVQTRMGGPSAPLHARASVAGMIGVLERHSLKDSGRFYDYSDKEIPW
jgi:NAD(P)-dependent dehydrogenase (short-subunit alcohol dehydrogenase family)